MKSHYRKETKLELESGTNMYIRSFDDNWTDIEIEIDGSVGVVDLETLESVIAEHNDFIEDEDPFEECRETLGVPVI